MTDAWDPTHLRVRPVVVSGAPGIPSAGPSGASAHLRAIADALGATRLVTPCAVDHRGPTEDPRTPLRITGRARRLPWLPGARDNAEIATGRRIERALAGQAPSVLWERHSLYCDAGWRLHAKLGVPWILEVNAPPAQERARWDRATDPSLAARWEREVIAAAPRVIAVSRWLSAWCRDLGAREVRHVPNGVSPHHGDRDATRRALGVEDRLVVGFVGSGRAWHGVSRLVALLDALPDAVALIVGTASVAHVRALHAGVVSEARVADLVAAMDVAVAPTLEDGPPWLCPLKLLHYRAQGTPIVATKVGDTGDLLGPGDVLLDDWRDAHDAVRTLAGRRTARWVRSWDEVVTEALAPSTRP
jgi:glycosyltransferase involved in cell wall biosynthesis